jgi:pimeloyl-ACP methyl ester carboxylesterase
VSADPVILLPGLAANAAVFAPQCEALPDIVVPPRLKPERGESLVEYAGRFARRLDPGRRCIVGGMSFGGIVATELCHHLDVERCLLIGSISHPRHLPRWARNGLMVAKRLPVWTARLPIAAARATRRLVDPLLSPVLRNLWDQAGAADAELAIWSLRAGHMGVERSVSVPDRADSRLARPGVPGCVCPWRGDCARRHSRFDANPPGCRERVSGQMDSRIWSCAR